MPVVYRNFIISILNKNKMEYVTCREKPKIIEFVFESKKANWIENNYNFYISNYFHLHIQRLMFFFNKTNLVVPLILY